MIRRFGIALVNLLMKRLTNLLYLNCSVGRRGTLAFQERQGGFEIVLHGVDSWTSPSDRLFIGVEPKHVRQKLIKNTRLKVFSCQNLGLVPKAASKVAMAPEDFESGRLSFSIDAE